MNTSIQNEDKARTKEKATDNKRHKIRQFVTGQLAHLDLSDNRTTVSNRQAAILVCSHFHTQDNRLFSTRTIKCLAGIF